MAFESLYIGTEAMKAAQGALAVTGHNIANVDTEGYTRQRANIASNTPIDRFPGQIGTGVKIENITRMTDSFTRVQLENENQRLGEYEVAADILEEIEQVFDEPTSSGLQTAMSEFFNAWQTLSDSPEEFGNRNLVVEQGKNLAERLNTLSTQLKDIQVQTDELIEARVTEINSITDRIAALNQQISKVEVSEGQNANDLRDDREFLYRKLNKIINVTAYEDQNNNLFVEAHGSVLVAHTKSIPLGTVADENGYMVPADASSGTVVQLKSGELYGAVEARDVKLQGMLDELDSLASKIIEEVNRVHAKGTSLNGFDTITGDVTINEPNVNLINAGLGTTLQNGTLYLSAYNSTSHALEEHAIAIDPYLDSLNDVIDRINTAFGGGVGVPGINVSASLTSDNKLQFNTSTGYQLQFVEASTSNSDSSDFLLATGVNTFFTGNSSFTIDVKNDIINDPSMITAGRSLSQGDNTNALEISDLANQYLMNNNQNTFSDFYGSIVSEAGTNSLVAQRNEENQDSLVKMLEARLLSTTGVSLDEESANLLVYQRMYQAGAKYVSIMDSVLNTLINGLV